MNALKVADLERSTLQIGAETRALLGQYMTPAPVATFMASLFGALPERVHLLDAGAGVGSLTAAFVQEACLRSNKPRSIDVTAYEVDQALLMRLEATLEACAIECRASGVEFKSRVVCDDYVLHAAAPLMAANSQPPNCAILNPPYAKINTTSVWRQALRTFSIETSNLYTAFVALALQQLALDGQLVAITPRSFCNGTYFAPFRRRMLDTAAIEHVHVYGSRRKAFASDAVLQENIIFRLTKGVPQPSAVRLSSSEGTSAVAHAERIVPFEEVVSTKDQQRFIRLPITAEGSVLATRVSALPATLKDLGITVSTGRVVDFRAREYLRKEPEAGSVPLIYPMHFKAGFVHWPRLGGRKANALVRSERTLDLMVPRGTYVLTKRFTSKEERRRIVAAVYDPAQIEAEAVGFENHLNYFHEKGRGLAPALARGLATFLNSTAADHFFRQFSGHTQVNATDLRNMPFPSRSQLEALGEQVGDKILEQAELDALIEPLLTKRLS